MNTDIIKLKGPGNLPVEGMGKTVVVLRAAWNPAITTKLASDAVEAIVEAGGKLPCSLDLRIFLRMYSGKLKAHLCGVLRM